MESKAQSVAWKRPISSLAKKFKSQPSAGKIMLTLFWGYGRRDFGSFQSKGSRSLLPAISTFRSIKEALRGRKFSSDEEVIGSVKNWLKT
jgi:hypothetical protein